MGPVVAETRVVERVPDDGVELTSIFSGRLRIASGGLITLITMIAFEAMAVGPALPTAARELHGLSAFGWAFTAFLIANVFGMVVAGQLSDAHGPRRPMIAGIVMFLAGLVIAGTATTMVQLVLARGVQGLGSGLLITASYVLIGETYPSHLQPKVFIATSGAWLLPSLVGPLVSGTLTQHASWRWVFLGLVPFVLDRQRADGAGAPQPARLGDPAEHAGRSAPNTACPGRRARRGRLRRCGSAPVGRGRGPRRDRPRRGRLGSARIAPAGRPAGPSGRCIGGRAARFVRRRVLRR